MAPIQKALVVPHKLAPPEVLEFLSNAKTALAAIESPVEAAQFVKQAEAIRYLAKKAEAAQGVQQAASKVAILAERKAGEILKRTADQHERHPGGGPRPKTGTIEVNKKGDVFRARGRVNGKLVTYGSFKTRGEAEERLKAHAASQTSQKLPTLSDLGIKKDAATRWQTLAQVPQKNLEEHIDEVIEAGGEPTTAEALRFVQRETAPTIHTVPAVNSVDVVYRFLDQAQIMARLFQTRSPAQLWKQANEEERRYMKKALADTVRLINKLLEVAT